MIRAYFSERLRPVLYLPLAGVIAVAAAGGDLTSGRFALDLALGWLLLAEFRLLDDLADRRTDALVHPERVLVRAESLARFVRLCGSLGIANVAWILARHGIGLTLALLVSLHLALGAWYLMRAHRSLAGDQLLLAKYPVFVLILSGPRLLDAPLAVASGAALVYAGASLYEAWHDPVSPLGNLLGGRS